MARSVEHQRIAALADLYYSSHLQLVAVSQQHVRWREYGLINLLIRRTLREPPLRCVSNRPSKYPTW